MAVLLIVISSVICLISVMSILYYFNYTRYLENYPGPSVFLLLIYTLIIGKLEDFLEVSLNFHRTYGNTIKIQLGFLPPVVQTTDPKFIEGVLGSTNILCKSTDYKFIERWLGTGLLTSGPTKWRKHRKILTPAFHFQILEQFIETFNLFSDILVDKLKQEQGNDSTDIYPFITLCSLDIICATSMGTAINAQNDNTSQYVLSVKEMARVLMERVVSLIAASDLLYKLTPNYWTQERAVKVLHDYSNSVIASRKQELQQETKIERKEENDLGIKERNTFLDTLLKYKLSGGTISDDEIRQEVDTFMFEGHDTTSSALSFTLYSLSNHRKIQQIAVDELHQIFGSDTKRAATSKDLSEMKYLEMVIKESLRLYPSVPFYGRQIEKNTEFNGGILPQNTTISIFAYGVHRNPEIYPDPEKFDPERFTLENQAKRSPYAYIPFSAGSRNCIGQRFAMLEMKTIISKVLRTFELFPASPEHVLQLVPELVLKSNTGVRIRLEKRRW